MKIKLGTILKIITLAIFFLIPSNFIALSAFFVFCLLQISSKTAITSGNFKFKSSDAIRFKQSQIEQLNEHANNNNNDIKSIANKALELANNDSREYFSLLLAYNFHRKFYGKSILKPSLATSREEGAANLMLCKISEKFKFDSQQTADSTFAHIRDLFTNLTNTHKKTLDHSMDILNQQNTNNNNKPKISIGKEYRFGIPKLLFFCFKRPNENANTSRIDIEFGNTFRYTANLRSINIALAFVSIVASICCSYYIQVPLFYPLTILLACLYPKYNDESTHLSFGTNPHPEQLILQPHQGMIAYSIGTLLTNVLYNGLLVAGIAYLFNARSILSLISHTVIIVSVGIVALDRWLFLCGQNMTFSLNYKDVISYSVNNESKIEAFSRDKSCVDNNTPLQQRNFPGILLPAIPSALLSMIHSKTESMCNQAITVPVF